MQEQITIRVAPSHAQYANELVESLKQQLLIGGGDQNAVVLGDPLFGLTVPQVRIEYTGSYSAVSSTGDHTLADSVQLAGEGDDVDAVPLRLMLLRAEWLNRSYRNTMRGINNLANDIESGTYTLPAGVSAAKYIADLSAAVLDAFPNTN